MECEIKSWPIAPDFSRQGLSQLSALEEARHIIEEEFSSQELVEHYLERIERYDRKLNAFVEVFADRALAEAEKADELRRRGKRLGPFHGVPTAVKDHHMVRFTRTRLGSRAFDWLWSPVDDGLVQRLRQAGFVLVGKTTMSELGLLPVVEPEEGAPTRNPWDPDRTAGGSSGGAGAADFRSGQRSRTEARFRWHPPCHHRILAYVWARPKQVTEETGGSLLVPGLRRITSRAPHRSDTKNGVTSTPRCGIDRQLTLSPLQEPPHG